MFPFFPFQVVFLLAFLLHSELHKVNIHCSQVQTAGPTESNTPHLLRKSQCLIFAKAFVGTWKPLIVLPDKHAPQPL